MTVILLGGQVLPFLLLGGAAWLSGFGFAFAVLAAVCAYLPRFIAARIFHQPLVGALLHPLGVLALLAIQWHARLRQFAGQPAEWKGRSYLPAEPAKMP